MPFNSIKAIRIKICCTSLDKNIFLNVVNFYLTVLLKKFQEAIHPTKIECNLLCHFDLKI